MDEVIDEFTHCPVMQELWRIRAERAAKFDYDIRRMMEDSQRRQYLSGRDLYARSKATGRIELVFRGSGQPIDAAEDAPVSDTDGDCCRCNSR
jgi:hypothetical protein